MMHRLGIAACLVMALLVGCTGAKGKDGATGQTGQTGPTGATGATGPTAGGSINAVIPESVFIGRQVTVTVSGFNTDWTGATAADVSFGAGVTVDSITVPSPTAIIANLTVTPTAAVGAHDVVVTKGGTVTYAAGFAVTPPIKVTVEGTLAQGSVTHVTVKNLDVEAPFDTSYTGDGYFTPIVYTGIQFTTMDGLSPQINSVSAYTLDLLLVTDVVATPGANDLEILSGTGTTPDHFLFPGALTVAARSAIALASGTAHAGTVTAPYNSDLYSLTAKSTLALVELAMTSSSTSGYDGLILLPSSGKFADVMTIGTSAIFGTNAADTYYAIYYEPTGDNGYSYTITGTVTDAHGAAAETEPNDATTSATAVTGFPWVVIGATLASDTDEDWYAVTVAGSDVGKKIHVVTYGFGNDQMTDTWVDVLASDGTTSLGGPSSDQGYQEDFLSDVTVAGTQYVRVYAGSYFSTTSTHYGLIIRLE